MTYDTPMTLCDVILHEIKQIPSGAKSRRPWRQAWEWHSAPPDAMVDIPCPIVAVTERHCVIVRHGDFHVPEYWPNQHLIHMPSRHQFYARADYSRILAHELVHWTMKPLGRVVSLSDRSAWATEEWTAELGAALLCAAVGIAPDVREHAVYLCKVARAGTPDMIRAVREAHEAVEFLLTAAPVLA